MKSLAVVCFCPAVAFISPLMSPCVAFAFSFKASLVGRRLYIYGELERNPIRASKLPRYLTRLSVFLLSQSTYRVKCTQLVPSGSIREHLVCVREGNGRELRRSTKYLSMRHASGQGFLVSSIRYGAGTFLASISKASQLQACAPFLFLFAVLSSNLTLPTLCSH